MQFETEDYRKIGFALYDYITLGYFHCSIDIINTKAKKIVRGYLITIQRMNFMNNAERSTYTPNHCIMLFYLTWITVTESANFGFIPIL